MTTAWTYQESNPVASRGNGEHEVWALADGKGFMTRIDYGDGFLMDVDGQPQVFQSVEAATAAIDAVLEDRPPAPPRAQKREPYCRPSKANPPEPAFKEFVSEQQLRDSAEASEIDQRAAASAIIAEDAAEFARNTRPDGDRGPNIAELVGSVIKYLDYQRAELTIRKPEGESGDIVWLINKTLSNAGVSPERSLVAAVQTLAYYMVDLYGQNAKIRRRLADLEAEAMERGATTEELIDCVAQFEEFMLPHDMSVRVAVSPAMRGRIEAAKKRLEEAEKARKEQEHGNGTI